MAIKYRDDADLSFLIDCENDDLNTLATYIIKGKDGKSRFSEKLSNDPLYKYCNGNYQQAWQQIAGELQLFGGDSLVNTIRGYGVLYKEILCDVCDKLKVNYNSKQEVSAIELNFFQKILSDAWENMTETERQELLHEMKIEKNVIDAFGLVGLIGGFGVAALLADAAAKMMLYQGGKILAAIGLQRGAAMLAGPIGIATTALLTLPSITGTAYRVTIPCVIQVAYMRQKLLKKDRF